MDRLITIEPSNQVAVRIEPGQRCTGTLNLRNVMCTMPVAFRLQAINKSRYAIRPQSGIISPLQNVTVEITYLLPSGSCLPDLFPYSDDSFLLHSVVVPGAAAKDAASNLDAIPSEWFTTKKKQVFIDSGMRVIFVGSPVLARLVRDGAMDEVREVLERSDPSWNPADAVDTQGQRLLHLSISRGRADLVQLLLEFGANIEALCGSDLTPLEAAASAGETLIVELLLARRGSTERSSSSSWGPIHLAAGGGHLEILRLLLLRCADVDSLTKDGNTALHLAVEERHRDCVRLLIVNGASTDICSAGSGETPLHVVARLGDEQTMRLLIQKGANKDVKNHDGKTAYDVAVEYGHVRLFDSLKLGDRLCSAASKGEVRAIRRLLQNGAVINGRDQHGWTALHRAAFKGHVDAVRMLLDKGVDLDAKDADGYTALHCATESGHADVVELLVKKRADMKVRTNKGATAFQIAESLHYAGITRLLVHGGANKESGKGMGQQRVLYGTISKNTDKKNKTRSKHGRTRSSVMRSSFDRSLPPTVV